jgi:hypothetical protein
MVSFYTTSIVETERFTFYVFGSSDKTSNGSEISDPDMLICKKTRK